MNCKHQYDFFITVPCRQQELESYELTDMVAATGGYLGLFIGLSCLSLYDLLCQFAGTLHAAMKKNYYYVSIHFYQLRSICTHSHPIPSICKCLNNDWFNSSINTTMLLFPTHWNWKEFLHRTDSEARLTYAKL